MCRDEDFPALLAEFKEFCQNSAHNIFFLGLTDYYLREYEKQGFGLVKSGEEARFKLADYEISGKKGAKMRMNINHATKAGVTGNSTGSLMNGWIARRAACSSSPWVP